MKMEIPEEFNYLEINPEMESAIDSIYSTKDNTLVLGAGGSGKSQLIKLVKAIDEREDTRTLFVAPTGVSAVNIGGATIHSTFNLGIDMRDPEDVWPTGEVRGLLENVERIVMDEVSMIRADIFDVVNVLCKRARGNEHPFGGIQVVCIGDLFQIPPIVGRTKEELYFYNSIYDGNPYFFGSEVYREYRDTFRVIHFTKIYRQEDSQFKDILNRIRVGEQTNADLDFINSHLMSHTRFNSRHKGGIYVAPFNKTVSSVNESSLKKLKGDEITFKATITGYSDPRNFQAPEVLRLKRGAKIMMLVNDSQGQYQNGTLGVFDSVVNPDTIKVVINGYNVFVHKYEFGEYKYKIVGGKLKKDLKGSFTQFPLTLGFAFTGHKSQGCTFESGYVDFGYKVFADHLVYVMLSRFRNFDKVGLKRHLKHEDITVSQHVLDFMEGKFSEVVRKNKNPSGDLSAFDHIMEDDGLPF